jgi:hypothetical protein
MGYLTIIDLVGTSFVSQAPRIHSEEYLIFDFGIPRPVDFLAIISPINENLGISLGATITLMGANVPNAWDAPAMSISIPVSSKGAFKFIDDQDSSYRYFKLKIVDRENNLGFIEASHLYMGDYVTIDDPNGNITNGFQVIEEDLSSSVMTESGRMYFDSNTKLTNFDNTSVAIFNDSTKNTIMELWEKLGKTTPFYVSLDPKVVASQDIQDLTRFVYFKSQPIFSHIIYNKWSCSFSLREVV